MSTQLHMGHGLVYKLYVYIYIYIYIYIFPAFLFRLLTLYLSPFYSLPPSVPLCIILLLVFYSSNPNILLLLFTDSHT